MPESPREIPYADIDVAAVRKYANQRANALSVRGLARRIGIGHSSLDKFLHGAEPYVRNRTRLCEWYVRETAGREGQAGPTEADAPGEPEAAMNALLRELRGEARSEARRGITHALAQGYRRMGLPEPEWLDE